MRKTYQKDVEGFKYDRKALKKLLESSKKPPQIGTRNEAQGAEGKETKPKSTFAKKAFTKHRDAWGRVTEFLSGLPKAHRVQAAKELKAALQVLSELFETEVRLDPDRRGKHWEAKKSEPRWEISFRGFNGWTPINDEEAVAQAGVTRNTLYLKCLRAKDGVARIPYDEGDGMMTGMMMIRRIKKEELG